jgi:septum formation protein
LKTRWPDILALGKERKIVLASSSPRRRSLLSEIGVSFETQSPQVPEIRLAAEPPFVYAVRLAKEKALAVAATLDSNSTTIGCDTIVILGDEVLEKPANEADAEETLSRLAGNRHIVCTAIALAESDGWLISGYDTTAVFFRPFSRQRIHEYVATGEPMDKAGSYGIQGMGAFLVDRIDGNLDTVVGLPRELLNKLARQRISEK